MAISHQPAGRQMWYRVHIVGDLRHPIFRDLGMMYFDVLWTCLDIIGHLWTRANIRTIRLQDILIYTHCISLYVIVLRVCNVSIYLSFPRDASDSSSAVCSAMGCHAKDPKAMCGDTMSFMYGQPALCSRVVLCAVLSCLSMFIYVVHGHEHEASWCIMMHHGVMICNDDVMM